MKRFLFPCLLLSLLLFVPSCTPSDRFAAGEVLDREGLASVSEALLATETEPDTDPSIETVADMSSYPSWVLHWTASGTVYHTRIDCHHLARAEKVYHGRKAAALAAGKDTLCSACERAEEN